MIPINLSQREFEVLNLISQERTNIEIARSLFLSPHTVISHRRNLLHKLDARNSAGLVRRAFEYGIIPLQPRGSYRLAAH